MMVGMLAAFMIGALFALGIAACPKSPSRSMPMSNDNKIIEAMWIHFLNEIYGPLHDQQSPEMRKLMKRMFITGAIEMTKQVARAHNDGTLGHLIGSLTIEIHQITRDLRERKL